jgi:hypothetical protein
VAPLAALAQLAERPRVDRRVVLRFDEAPQVEAVLADLASLERRRVAHRPASKHP